MSYVVVFLNIFLRQFRKLPDVEKSRVRQRIQELAENPYLGLRLTRDLEGFWKDRVGKYRIIYKIDEPQKKLIFYDVDLRKRVYQ